MDNLSACEFIYPCYLPLCANHAQTVVEIIIVTPLSAEGKCVIHVQTLTATKIIVFAIDDIYVARQLRVLQAKLRHRKIQMRLRSEKNADANFTSCLSFFNIL